MRELFLSLSLSLSLSLFLSLSPSLLLARRGGEPARSFVI
jgi:hypothetical protein